MRENTFVFDTALQKIYQTLDMKHFLEAVAADTVSERFVEEFQV